MGEVVKNVFEPVRDEAVESVIGLHELFSYVKAESPRLGIVTAEHDSIVQAAFFTAYDSLNDFEKREMWRRINEQHNDRTNQQ